MQLRNRLISLNTHISYIVLVLLPVVALFVSRISNAAFIALALIPVILFIWDRQWLTLYRSPPAKIICAWFSLGLVSLLWTLDPSGSLRLLAELLCLYLGTYALFYFLPLLDYVQKKRLVHALIFSSIIALLLANSEIIFNSALSNFLRTLVGKTDPVLLTSLNRGAVLLSLLCWPVLAYFRLHPEHKNYTLYFWLFFFAFFLTLLRLESQSATLAFMVGSVAWLWAKSTNRTGMYILMVLIACLFVTIPILAFLMDPTTVFHAIPTPSHAAPEYRLHIWHFAAVKAELHSWLGWGFNASRNIPVAPEDYLPGGRHPLPLHPHNNILQVWLELGIAGLIIFYAFLVALIQRIYSLAPHHRGAALALMGSFFMTGATGFGIWQHWFIASGIIASIVLTIVFTLKNPNQRSL